MENISQTVCKGGALADTEGHNRNKLTTTTKAIRASLNNEMPSTEVFPLILLVLIDTLMPCAWVILMEFVVGWSHRRSLSKTASSLPQVVGGGFILRTEYTEAPKSLQ